MSRTRRLNGFCIRVRIHFKRGRREKTEYAENISKKIPYFPCFRVKKNYFEHALNHEFE